MNELTNPDAVRSSTEYKTAATRLGDREWRLDNLYWIKNKDGVPIPFKRNYAQKLYSGREWYRDTILKSRQLGFSTYISIEILDKCLFASNTTADIIDRTQSDAEKKLAMIRFAYERLSESIKNAVYLKKDNQSELVFSNGSSIGAGTSSRGGTPQMLHVSEMGIISADNPRKAKEIKTGSFTAVPQGGKIWVESTAKGTSGEFYDLVQAGEQLQATGQKLTPLDFKLHFFGWHNAPENRLQTNLVNIPHDMREYFLELENKYNIRLDGMQQAWYVKTREILGPDDMKSEHPTTPQECFYASLEGAYFKDEMNAARRDRRIGQAVPYDRSRPVFTGVDIGLDGHLAVVFMQTDGVRNRVIDFARGELAGLADYIRIIKDKAEQRGFVYAKQHYAPHDMGQRDWSAMPQQGLIAAPTRAEICAEHGINILIIPRIPHKADAIEAARRLINTTWFCSEYAGGLVEALDNYTRKWDKLNSRWLAEPAKNGFDHPSDAFMCLAMGLKPEVAVRKREQFRTSKRGSHWSS